MTARAQRAASEPVMGREAARGFAATREASTEPEEPSEAASAVAVPRTPAEARSVGLVALTTPDRPSAKLETVAGPVPWMDWCRREAERVRQSGRQAVIVKDADGKASVWVSPSPHLKPEPLPLKAE